MKKKKGLIMESELMEKTTPNTITSTLTVNGMTCRACVKTITDKVLAISGLTYVDISFDRKTVA